MIAVGMDVHKAFSFLTAVDERGKVLEQRKLANNPRVLSRYFGRFESPPRVAMEACWNWQWISDLLARKGCAVSLAHPLKTKAIASAKIKTDKVDSAILAHLLRTDLLPTAYIATPQERQAREILRHRLNLVQSRTALANQVHALLAQRGTAFPYTTLFSQKGRRFLQALALPPVQSQRLAQIMAQDALLEQQIKEMDQLIQEEGSKDPRVARLVAIPGIGTYTAMVFLSEVGPVSRFPDAGHLCSYLGLVPSLHQSGTTRRFGHITKQGSRYARYALVQAAHHAARGPYRAFFQRVKDRRGPSIAYVAVARKLAVAAYTMLKGAEEFGPSKAG